jgi:two-component system NtrC family sensor kinase
MPGLDGPAFHRVLGERRPELARRMLFTTGDTLSRETADFLEQSRLPYLAKPFHVEELYGVVTNFLAELNKEQSLQDATQTH